MQEVCLWGFPGRMNSSLHLEGEFVDFRDALDTIGIDLSNALTAVRNQMNILSEQWISLR